MTRRSRTSQSIVALGVTNFLLAGILLYACSAQAKDFAVTPEQIRSVCQDGGKIANSPPYERGAKSAHPIRLFQGAKDLLDDQTYLLPVTWSTRWTAPNRADLVQLVACSTRTSDELVKTCENYAKTAANGPLVGGASDTFNKVVMYNATYTVDIRSLHTGEVVGASMTITAANETCPATVEFGPDSDIKTLYATDAGAIAKFVEPFVKPGV
jgi:hypothetical protein